MYIAIAILLLVFFIYLAVKRPGTALLASLPASVIYAVLLTDSGFEYDTAKQVAFLISDLIFPVTLVLITFIGIKTSATERRWPHFLAFWMWRICFYIFTLVIMALIMNIIGVVIWFMCMMLAYRIGVTSKQSMALDVVSTIGACIRQNLPLAMAMETAAEGYNGRRKEIFKDISKWLTEGYPLSDALKMGFHKCPTYITSMIDAAERVNQLPEAIRSIEAEIAGNLDENKKIRPVHPTYPVIVVTVATMLMLGLTIFIMPTFAAVLHDMSQGTVALPKSTQILIDIAAFSMSGRGFVAMAIVLFLVFINIGVPWIKELYRNCKRKIDNPGLITRLGDYIKWHLPILHWFEFNYSIMRVTGLIRVSLAAGTPVNDAIRSAQQLDVNNCFRKRLSRWVQKIEQGQNVSAAALDTGMGNSLAWAFDDKVNAGNTPEILEMLEKFYRGSYNFKANLLRSIGLPCIILLLSVVVGFIVYAMFTPMIAITTFLTETALP